MLMTIMNCLMQCGGSCGCIPAPCGTGYQSGVIEPPPPGEAAIRPMDDNDQPPKSKPNRKATVAWLADLKVTAASLISVASGMVAIYFMNDREGIYELPLSSNSPVTIVGSLFGFLLTFRCSQSYGRWFEGRGHVGAIHAGCRYLAVVINGAAAQCDNATHKYDESKKLKDDAARLFRALFRSVILHLREEPDNSSLWPFLTPDEWQALSNAKGARPVLIMKMITSGINYLSHEKLVISDYRACAQACSKMTTSFNGADKLINTPNPNVLMYIMLIVYVFTMWFLFPWYFATHNGSYGWLIFQLYCYSYTIGCLIFIARDMDNPFDGGTIDLPLEKYEGSLAKDLTMILKSETSSSLHTDFKDFLSGQADTDCVKKIEKQEEFDRKKEQLGALFSSSEDEDEDEGNAPAEGDGSGSDFTFGSDNDEKKKEKDGSDDDMDFDDFDTGSDNDEKKKEKDGSDDDMDFDDFDTGSDNEPAKKEEQKPEQEDSDDLDFDDFDVGTDDEADSDKK